MTQDALMSMNQGHRQECGNTDHATHGKSHGWGMISTCERERDEGRERDRERERDGVDLYT